MLNISGHLNFPTTYGCVNTTPNLVALNDKLSFLMTHELAGPSWAVLVACMVLAGTCMLLYSVAPLAGAGVSEMATSMHFQLTLSIYPGASSQPQMASLPPVV